MSAVSITVILFAGILLLMFLGVRVAYALIAVSIVALVWLVEPPQLTRSANVFWGSINSFTLTAIPLFVLMGDLLYRSRFAEDAFGLASRLLRRVPGGAVYGNIVGSMVFSSMSGSSVANAATIGTVSGLPMSRMGYDRRLVFGSIAAGGTLGILMPPSTVLIIYGGLTGESIGSLFLAGIVPAFIGALLFCGVILAWSLTIGLINRDAIEETEIDVRSNLNVVLSMVAGGALVIFVLGGIYFGVFSATEAGGMGAFGALVLSIIFGRFQIKLFAKSLRTTVGLSSAILFIIGGASVLNFVVATIGAPQRVSSAIAAMGISTTSIIILVCLLYITLGLFIESASLIVLTVPVVYPILMDLGIDGIWLGVLIVVMVEIGLITPPVGLNLFVLDRIPAGQTFKEIAIGAFPFVVCLIVLAGILIAFPSTALWLPSMRR